ncbi:MAG: glucose-6-phosphate isomerase family protein [Patescibacteria group bacterium]
MDISKLKPQIRDLEDIKDVIYDREWLKKAKNFELYYMYRDLAENELDRMKIMDSDLRYDITIILPLMLGKEFNKTLGHDHPIVPGTSITYPELYEVLEGEAIFLLQDSKDEEIKDVFAIKAKKGDKAIMLPNYEHLIINPLDKQLKICNWICRSFASNIYKPFRARHGFCYYAIKDPSTKLGVNWIKNEEYESIDPLRFEEPNNFYGFDLKKDEPIYKLVNNLEKLEFLVEPQKYEWH